jgi:hypothetical protein
MNARDRVIETLTEALAQALATPGEHRLFRSGKLDGLFPARTGASAEAAETAPRGVEFLHEYESPTHALHELRDTLRANQQAIPMWLAGLRQTLQSLETRLIADAARWSERLEALERRVADTLRRLEAAGPLVPPEVLEQHPWSVDALNYLDRRRTVGAADDCPLAELFDAVRGHHPELPLSAFFDGVRKLHQRRAVRLRPAGEDEEMGRPEYALLDGDCVYYYAAR